MTHNETLPRVDVWTDGACLGNPGPGGWGALLIFGPQEKELSGSEAASTNNRMELMAAIEGLNALTKPCHVTLYTDSQYVKNGLTQWMKGWKAKGWKTADNKPVKNKELWLALDAACARHTIEWKWVKGHSGIAQNERVDVLARNAAEAVAISV